MSKRTVIYMNHRIRDKVPDGPVIRVQRGRKQSDTNEALLVLNGQLLGRVVYDPPNNPSSSHEVKAWVELDPCVEVMT